MIRGLTYAISAAALLSITHGDRRKISEALLTGDCKVGGNSSHWNLVLPDSIPPSSLQSSSVSIDTYTENEPHALYEHLTSFNYSLTCFRHYGVAFPNTGGSWIPEFRCLEEQTTEFVVINSGLTLADCSIQCEGSNVAGMKPGFCALLTGELPGAGNESVPSFLLTKSALPLTHIASLIQQSQMNGTTSDVTGGREGACSSESVAAALLLRSSAHDVHVCMAEVPKLERLVPFLPSANSSSTRANPEASARMLFTSIAVLVAIVVSGVAWKLAAEYPTTMGLTLNTLSSVGIIFTNKVLYKRGVSYVVTLSGLNYLATASVGFCINKGTGKRADIPLKEKTAYVLVNSASLLASNLSLFLNSVGFYQISKLMLIPTTCLLEHFVQGTRFSPPLLTAVALVLTGVGTATVSDVSVTLPGMLIAVLGVITAAGMQVSMSVLQKKHNLKPEMFVAQTSPYQAALLILSGPFLDRAITGKWVFSMLLEEDSRLPVTLFFISLSCTIAIVVNVSQAMTIGSASAAAFQVLGHSKTLLVLIIAYLFFDSHWTAKSLTGAGVALVGIIAYGLIRNREQQAKQADAPGDAGDTDKGGNRDSSQMGLRAKDEQECEAL